MGTSASRPRPAPPPIQAGGAPPPLPPTLRSFSDDELFAATAGFARRRALGEGGFGRVYAGELQDGTRIAVKLLDRTGLQGEAEWRNEIATLTSLPRHPAVVPLIGACADGRVRAAVLAAVAGPSVRDALAPGATSPPLLPWPARLAAAAGAAAGLAHAHAHGVAHGDVASVNLLADTSRGGAGVLCDFGLARRAGGPPAERVGQPAYAGPEAAAPLPLPAAATAAAADMYALGVVMCELLTGAPPHTARAAAPLDDWPALVAALDGRLFDGAGVGPPAHQVAAVAEAAAGCLAAAPGERPPAAAVAAYLQKAAAGGGSAPVTRPPAVRPLTPSAAPPVPPLVDVEGAGAAGGATPRSRAALEAAVAAAPLSVLAAGNPFA